MAHLITMDGYIKNPVGKGSANVARRDMIRRNLESRYLVMLKQSKSMFKIKDFFIDKVGNYILHMEVPSEYYYKEGLFYDVVIQFMVTDSSRVDLTLKNYRIRLYSNSPAFMFTYGYVYNKDENLVPFLKNKLSSLALTKAPVIRNPDESYGYEKSVYFAILFLRDNPRLTNKAMINSKPLKLVNFVSSITTSVAKEKEYRKAKKENSLKKKEANKLKATLQKTIKDARVKSSENKSRKTVNNKFKSVVTGKNAVNMKRSMNIRKNGKPINRRNKK